ncbi:MAG TPA: hypothetical protein VHR66_28140 [Gemmataceae bacterium]|jgi:hypothetical protein|nr:hypothetical protein [Gemmataceae bacterium]
MGQEHEDYEERSVSPFWLPPVGLIVVLFALLISGGLFLITLLAANGVFRR